MKFLLSLSLLSVLPTLPAPVVQDDASIIVGRAARVYRGLTSLRADFKQVIDDEAVGTFESRGVMVQSGQSKLTMRFSDPRGDAIVLDGRYVWVYTPSTTPGQVLRMPIPTGPVYGFNVLAWLLDKPAERYRSRYLKRDFVDFVQTDVVELVPLADDLPFRKATLWLDRDTALPRKVVIEERAGGTRTLTLSKLRTNDPVTDKTFQFEVPNGVRIIEQS